MTRPRLGFEPDVRGSGLRRGRCRLLLSAVLLVVFTATSASIAAESAIPAAEDPAIAEARMAVRQHDYERAIAIWRSAAKRGTSEAAYRLGVAYRSGLGVEKNNAEAVRWFRMAAERRHHGAQFALGTFYQNGIEVPQDRDEAMRLLGLAAEGGHREARERLSEIRDSGSVAYATSGARVTANRSDPRAALNQAIRLGDRGAAVEALARGAPINGAPGDRRHWRPLILAIDRRQLEIMRLLLERGADPNLRSRIGEPALVLAVRSGVPALTRVLLEAGADPDRRAVSGYTPAMEAARLGKQGVVQALLAARADLALVLEDGTSAADVARRAGHDSLSQELRRRGAPIVAGSDPEERRRVLAQRSTESSVAAPDLPPVVEAARRGDADLLREMVERGIDLSVRDLEGGNALTRAVAGGHLEASKILLAAGVAADSPGREGSTALMRAMELEAESADAIFEILIDAGADLHARDESGRAVIDFATFGATPRKLDLLSKAGGSWTGPTLALALAEAAANGRRSVVVTLLPRIERSAEKAAATCRAVEQGHLEILDLLAVDRAALEGDCGEGHGPIGVAAQKGDATLVERLLAAGATADGNRSERDTALIGASGRGHREIVERLIGAGADVNRRGSRRMTALMAAASRGHPEIVELLLRAGADPGMRSDTKRTALDLARQAENQESVRLIESHRSGWRALMGAIAP